jgi:hypothetical protein
MSKSALSTCGDIPRSDGPLADHVTVALLAPTTAPSGSIFDAGVQLRSRTTTPVWVLTSSNVVLVITQDGKIVGRPLGAAAATGAGTKATPTSPPAFSAQVLLSGCGDYASRGPSPDTADLTPESTRVPLPAGSYTIYAIVEDDTLGEENPRNLVSEPFTLHVTPAGTVSSPAAGMQSAGGDRTFTAAGSSFRYPSAWKLSRFNDPPGTFATLLAVLSNEPVHDPCATTTKSETCTTPLTQLGTGGVLIEWIRQLGLGEVFAMPSGSTNTIDGKPAVLSTDPTNITQCAGIGGTVYEVDAYVQESPGNTLDMAACLAAPAAPQTVIAVQTMLVSLRFDQGLR